eukprot:GILI01030324.1.p1 GENE.GILI01030324.1~~GILI01030324.1.p1  ORF type:complete len:273 (-),score=48.90 GILI01030324.1:102-920(-)
MGQVFHKAWVAMGCAPSRMVPRRPLKEFSQSYKLGALLGRGGFSVVKQARNKQTNENFAVKIVQKDHEVIQIVEMFEDQEELWIVLELCSGGELFEVIDKRQAIVEEDAKKYMHSLLEALGYLHRVGIVHRDIKPENILLGGPDGTQVKISDFGLASRLEPGRLLSSACGTDIYIAPEMIRKTGYDFKVDIWAAGVICYVLLCGFAPYEDDDTQKLYKKIQDSRPTFPSPQWDTISLQAKDFVTYLLHPKPDNRPSAEQALNHPWMKSYLSS